MIDPVENRGVSNRGTINRGTNNTGIAAPPKVNTPSQFVIPVNQEFEQLHVSYSLDEAQRDPLWLETNIQLYYMENLHSSKMIIVYNDGNSLSIPILSVHDSHLPGGSVTLFKRHRRTGRIVPFSTDMLSFQERLRQNPLPSGTTLQNAIHTMNLPLRFDPDLTPRIYTLVNAEITRNGIISILELGERMAMLNVLRILVNARVWGLITLPRITAGLINAGVNLLDQVIEHWTDFSKYNWPSVGADFIFGMISQGITKRFFDTMPAPIFSRKALELGTWVNFTFQQSIFALYGTLVGLIRSSIGNTSQGRTVASQHLVGVFQSAKSGAMDSFLKSQNGKNWFPNGKGDIRIIFISKILGLAIKAGVRQGLDVTPRSSSGTNTP